MSNLKKVLWATAILGLVVCGGIVYTIYSAIFSPNTAFENEKAFVFVPTDANFSEVINIMEPLLKDLGSFEAVAERKGYVSNIKGGKYAILKGMNNNDIINTLRSVNIPVKVSFNNQETVEDLAGRIAAQLEPDSLSLLQVLTDIAFLSEKGFDKENLVTPYLPNTYEFFWNTTPEQFRERMLKEYHRFWNEERQNKAQKLGMTPMQVAALAAIVQKETVKADERPKVAGVYLNRLKKGMFLQADPTVIYAIKKETGNFDTIIKRVLYRDLEMDSPYNTYKYSGVPPGPITMPDISSLEAVLNAEKHNYLYFVADVSNFGYHMFASTLQQHNRNKVQYVRWLNQQKISR